MVDIDLDEKVSELLFVDGLTVNQAHKVLTDGGVDITPGKILGIKNKLERSITSTKRDLALSNLVLGSVEGIRKELDELFAETKEILKEAKSQGNFGGALMTIRELREQLKLAMNSFNNISKSIKQNVQNQQINVYNNVDFNKMVSEIHENIFDSMGAELRGETIVLHTPSAEFLEDFNNWKKKKDKEIIEVAENGGFKVN